MSKTSSKEYESVQVAITCRHGRVPESIQEYMNEKSAKLLNYFERVTSIQVTIDYESDRAKVEMLVDAEHRHNFVATAIGEDVRSSFDSVLHKMETQIRKYKEKLQDHRRDVPTNQVTTGDSPE